MLDPTHVIRLVDGTQIFVEVSSSCRKIGSDIEVGRVVSGIAIYGSVEVNMSEMAEVLRSEPDEFLLNRWQVQFVRTLRLSEVERNYLNLPSK